MRRANLILMLLCILACVGCSKPPINLPNGYNVKEDHNGSRPNRSIIANHSGSIVLKDISDFVVSDFYVYGAVSVGANNDYFILNTKTNKIDYPLTYAEYSKTLKMIGLPYDFELGPANIFEFRTKKRNVYWAE